MSPKIFPIAVLFIAITLVLVAGCTADSGKTNTSVTEPSVNATPVPASTSDSSVASRIPSVISTRAIPLETTPAELPELELSNGSVARYYAYTSGGIMGLMPLALSTSVYDQYQKMGKPSVRNVNYSTYYLRYMDETLQKSTITDLARAIRNKEPDKNLQARIAISLIQHIPPTGGESYRYPFEVLYEQQGTASEKAMLLAILLKELNVGSAVFYFVPENQMAAGIKAASPYDYQGTGYAFIDTTEPMIITDDSRDYDSGTLSSLPEVIPVGVGASLTDIGTDYKDARTWITIQNNLGHLSNMQYRQWESLNRDYDLSYFTCQECRFPAGS